MKAIINANVFDGKHEKLKENVTVVIDNNLIKEITNESISLEEFDEVIDAKGKTVIPGLIDSHVHLSEADYLRNGARVDELVIAGVANAKNILERGFTTVRDAGGITYGLKAAIDRGVVDGPRIYPSNSFISQTSGHGDFRKSKAEYRLTDGIYVSGELMTHKGVLVDGVAEVLRAVREQLFLNASQIKIMAGGGCMSTCDPIETVQFTYEEMKAAVDAAADYGTYVMAHLYTPKAMLRALKAGVKSFEHGQLMDEETAKALADAGAFLDPCPNFSKRPPDIILNNPQRKAKSDMVARGEITQAELIEKYNITILYGTDGVTSQLPDIHHYKERFGSFKTLTAATGNYNEIVKYTTYQNPYPEGKVGVLEEGAFADILVVEDNPVKDADVLTDVNNIRVIIKDGKIYKNTL